MRISKSLAVLASSADTASPDRKRQARRRSSLDTFVIPGRTRLPSSRVSQPEPMDLKIAENLLNAESRVPPRKSSDPNRRSVLNPPKCRRSDAKTARTEDDEDLTPDSPPRFHLDVSALPHSGTGSHLDEVPGTFEVNDIDEHPGSRPRRHVGGGSSGHTVGQQDLSLSYDGPNDASSNGSRNTTSTWTTVSHRNFTSSSAGSQRLGSGPSILEYNRLATEHGLVELAEAPDCLASGEFIYVLDWRYKRLLMCRESQLTGNFLCYPRSPPWLDRPKIATPAILPIQFQGHQNCNSRSPPEEECLCAFRYPATAAQRYLKRPEPGGDQPTGWFEHSGASA